LEVTAVAILSLREAALQVGVSRPTIYRKAASGELSVVQRLDGSQGVDTSELLRVFGQLRPTETVSETRSVTKQDSPETLRVSALQGELDGLRRMLDFTQAALAKAEDREARLLAILEQQTRLLEHKPFEAGRKTSRKTQPKDPKKVGRFSSKTRPKAAKKVRKVSGRVRPKVAKKAGKISRRHVSQKA
jgi:excisionase family DNA binding protein